MIRTLAFWMRCTLAAIRRAIEDERHAQRQDALSMQVHRHMESGNRAAAHETFAVMATEAALRRCEKRSEVVA